MANEKDQKEVFVSYSTKDTELAQFLCNQLEGSGATCWIAPRDIPSASQWASEIVKGIENADVFLLLVSEASVGSGEVAKEIDLANSMKRIMIPVRIENAALKGGSLYHLSSKQWVDALAGDKFTRFNATVDVVLKGLKKDPAKREIVAGSVADMARNLVNTLNQKHRERLSKINAMFTSYEKEKDVVKLTLPLSIGASGVDVIFLYDGNKKAMEIYADAANDGDPMREQIMRILETFFVNMFPHRVRTRKNKWKFYVLMPETVLTTPLASLSPERCFELFKENMTAFSDKVLPKLFDWIEYARNVIDAINRLEERLKEVFPKSEGWCVGAPEGSRLNGCWEGGKICVYKENWQPKDDNYNNRGWLSFALESGQHFLNDIYIGILKYEPWMTLKDWEGQIVSECGKPVEKWDAWVWWQRLDEEWGYSGIAQGDFRWDNKFDGFVEHCVEKFTKLKTLEPLMDMDQVCSEMKAMQVLDGDLETLTDVDPSLVLHNKFMRIVDFAQKAIDNNFAGHNIKVDFRHREGWFNNNWNDINLKFKVQKFDAAVIFKCCKNQMITEVTNLEPPDFETDIIKEFFGIKDVKFTQNKVEKEYNGGTFLQWLDEFQRYVEEQIKVVIPVIIDLKKHLENVVELTRQVEKELVAKLPAEEGWVVKNEALSLEKYDSIAIWNKEWLQSGSDLPLLAFQITPERPCFDDLRLAVKLFDRPLPEIERNLGEVCGACDFAFGRRTETGTDELWKKVLDAPFAKTGGSQFDIKLIDGEQRDALLSHIGGVAVKVKQMESIIGAACRMQNEVKYKNELFALIDDIIKTLSDVFPKEEGWEYYQDAKSLEQYSGIFFYKTTWKQSGLERGVLSFSIECDSSGFDNLYWGIVKGSDEYTIELTKEELLLNKMTELFGGGRKGSWHPYYKYFDKNIRGLMDDKEGFLMRIRDDFSKLKEYVTPIVDDIITTGSITKNE